MICNSGRIAKSSSDNQQVASATRRLQTKTSECSLMTSLKGIQEQQTILIAKQNTLFNQVKLMASLNNLGLLKSRRKAHPMVKPGSNMATLEHTLLKGCLGIGSKPAGLFNLDAQLSKDHLAGIEKLA